MAGSEISARSNSIRRWTEDGRRRVQNGRDARAGHHSGGEAANFPYASDDPASITAEEGYDALPDCSALIAVLGQ